MCVDEDTTAGYVVTLSANSARLSSLSTKPVRAWKIFFSVNWIVLTRKFSSFLYFLISAQFSELQPDSNLRYHFLLSLR